MRLLIVDDLADTKCMGLIRKCQNWGIDVEIKKAVNPALRRINWEEKKIDGIVLDMGLPLQDEEPVLNTNEGESILRELQRIGCNIPVLIFSERLVNTSSYAHIFDQMKDWCVVEEEKKFENFLEELKKREEE